MTMESEVKLDDLDWRLLDALQENARLTFAELSRRLPLSPPAIAERVRRLEAVGVIAGYHAEVNPRRVGLPIEAVIRTLGSKGRDCRFAGEQVKQVPEVLECYRVAGSNGIVIRVIARSIDHLDDLLSRVAALAGETETSIVLDSPVRYRPIGRCIAETSDPRALAEDQASAGTRP